MRGPIGDAVRILAEPPPPPAATSTRTAGKRGGKTAPPPPPPVVPAAGTAAFLAELLDLRGSVTLADALGDLEDKPGTVYDPRGATALLTEVRARFEEIDAKLDKAALELVEGRASALAASRVSAALLESIDDPRGVDPAAREIWTPVADYLALRLERARASAADLRDEAGPLVARYSAEASRLVRLDAVLQEVTRDAEVKLLARLPPVTETRFAREVVRIVDIAKGKGIAITEPFVRSVLGRGGPLRRIVEAAVDVHLALFRYDRMRIEALVEACARTVSV